MLLRAIPVRVCSETQWNQDTAVIIGTFTVDIGGGAQERTLFCQ